MSQPQQQTEYCEETGETFCSKFAHIKPVLCIPTEEKAKLDRRAEVKQARKQFNVDENSRLKSHEYWVFNIQEHVDSLKRIEGDIWKIKGTQINEDITAYEEKIKYITKKFNTNKKARHSRFKKKWSRKY